MSDTTDPPVVDALEARLDPRIVAAKARVNLARIERTLAMTPFERLRDAYRRGLIESASRRVHGAMRRRVRP